MSRNKPVRKQIEMASTAGIEMFEDIMEDFMLDIFGFEPGQYLITDESSLHDFIGVGDMHLADILRKIRDVYGLDVFVAHSSSLNGFGKLREVNHKYRSMEATDR